MTLTPIIWSAIVLLMVSFTLWFALTSFQQIFAMVNSGERKTLTNTWQERALSVMEYVFGQKKVLEERSYGFMHFFYLYGFLILGIGHMELVFFGLTRFLENNGHEAFLYRNFLPSGAVKAYEFTQDFMAGAVVLVVTIALYRRLTGKVKRLMPRSLDAEIILWLIGGLYLTFFIYIGTETFLRMQSGDLTAQWHWYLPISSAIALGISGVSNGVAQGLCGVGYWAHLSIFLFFACYIPRSKHMHLVAAGPNIYFRNFGSVAKPRTIDFETAEKYGVDRVQELPWKSILDSFACTECGRCDAVCPANLTGKPLRPKKVLHDIKVNLRYDNWPEFKKYRDARGRPLEGKEQEEMALEPKTPLVNKDGIDRENKEQVDKKGGYNIDGQVHLDEIWACTTCAACVEVCPVLIDSVPTSLIEMRRNFILMEAQNYPKELNTAMKGMEIQGNPWGVGQDKRTEWAQQLDVPLMSEQGDREVEYLFWVGCAGATDDRAKKIQQALVRVLKKANIDFAILGCQEKCTGDPARRMGNEYVYDALARENVELLKSKKFKKIFATCPHCFNQLKNEYKDFGATFEVYHHTELLAELLKDGRIPLDDKKKIEESITFHDPCYLGRYNQQYAAPRDALKALGAKPVEMSFSEKKSFCCGAGGGRMFMEEPIGKRVNIERTEQAVATGAKTVATGCPFCMTMLTDGVKDKGIEEQMQVKDLAELVAERLAD